MFDIGVSELAVIGVVALIVIGPEELPRVARTAGHLLGRLRRYVADVKSDISREMEAADLKRLQESAEEFHSSIKEQVQSTTADFSAAHAEIASTMSEATPSSPPAAPSVPSQQHIEEAAPAIVERDENQMDLFGAKPDVHPSADLPRTDRS